LCEVFFDENQHDVTEVTAVCRMTTVHNILAVHSCRRRLTVIV